MVEVNKIPYYDVWLQLSMRKDVLMSGDQEKRFGLSSRDEKIVDNVLEDFNQKAYRKLPENERSVLARAYGKTTAVGDVVTSAIPFLSVAVAVVALVGSLLKELQSPSSLSWILLVIAAVCLVILFVLTFCATSAQRRKAAYCAVDALLEYKEKSAGANSQDSCGSDA